MRYLLIYLYHLAVAMSEIIDTLMNNGFFSFIPAISAVAISIRNWLVLRKGADIHPLPFVNYAIWSIKRGEVRNKVLLLPMLFDNSGVSNGLVTGIEIAFGKDGKFQPVTIRRKIEMNPISEQELRNLDLTGFRNRVLTSVNPTYPIPVYAHESTSILLECFDGDTAIPIGEPTNCRITIQQGNGRSNTVEFPFLLKEQQFEDAVNNLTWF